MGVTLQNPWPTPGDTGPEYVSETQAVIDEIDTVLTAQDGRLGAVEHSARRVVGNALAATLSEGRASLALQVLGDSTGNESDEWVNLIAEDLAAAYPGYEVRHYFWNSGSEVMPLVPTVVQTPPAGDRRVTFENAVSASRLFDGPAITGDLDVRVKVQLPLWDTGQEATFACQFTSPPNRGWRLFKLSTAALGFDWSTDGTNLQPTINFGPIPGGPTTPIWLRVTLDVDNGSSGHDFKAYTSTDGTTWAQLGATTTRAGVTSIANVNAPFEIGGRNNVTGVITGSIYEVHILDSINGSYLRAPALPEHWYGVLNNSPAPNGSPILSFVNGSHPGAGLAYLDGGTTLEKMTPDYGQIAVIISDGHNEITRSGPSLYTAMAAYLTSVRARMVGIPILAVTQNPQSSPQTEGNIQAQAARRANYLSWETPLGWTVIDTYKSFLDDERGLAALIENGLHTTPEGSRVWADAVEAALGIA